MIKTIYLMFLLCRRPCGHMLLVSAGPGAISIRPQTPRLSARYLHGLFVQSLAVIPRLKHDLMHLWLLQKSIIVYTSLKHSVFNDKLRKRAEPNIWSPLLSTPKQNFSAKRTTHLKLPTTLRNMRIGFLGLGTMGKPMALNLCRKCPVTVWNRTASKYTALTQAGATIGPTPSTVVEQSDIVFTMLFDATAIESTIDDKFRVALRGKTLINTSSVSVEFSHSLARQVHEAGGKFVEMPVSGSKVPAEQGRLVGMMAGDPTVCERIQPFVEPITSAAVYCGPIGAGLKTKYAVNVFLITVTAGLAESMNLARAQGLNLEAVSQVLDAGPLASAYSKLKLAKILRNDWSAQAAVNDCYNSTELIQAAAKEAGAKSPLIQVCNSLYRQARESGLDKEDMITVYKVLSDM